MTRLRGIRLRDRAGLIPPRLALRASHLPRFAGGDKGNRQVSDSFDLSVAI